MSNGRYSRLVDTYCAVTSLLEDFETAIGGERLGAGDNSFCAVNYTSPAGKRDELGVRGWIDTVPIQRHDDKCVYVLIEFRVSAFRSNVAARAVTSMWIV